MYKGLKPVYWCPDCNTALAEAEIEYANDPCTSIYVKFNVTDDKGLFTGMGLDLSKIYFVIWTTTTWTIPGNLAICLGPEYEYTLVKNGDEYYVMAAELVKVTMETAGIEEYTTVGSFTGAELEHIKTKHPLYDRLSPVIVGDHVTLESGTGCVHTAPGYGVEDFEVCKNYDDIGILVCVDAKGKQTEEAGEFAGLDTNEANKAIAAKLEETGALLASQHITHQYPHCWRCNSPIIYRATEQWFCSVNGFKDEAVKAIENVKWIPEWGEDRIKGMVRDRSDWCISRQRTWGVPIPIIYCKDCGKPIVTDETIKAISDLFRKEGADAWWTRELSEFIPDTVKCECGCGEFTKEYDIMDVWFDSGVSHTAVMDEYDSLTWPADLYLEGADQYRGWFQSSLLTSVGAFGGGAPFKECVTHGWTVDGEGKAMHKSLGNGVDPADVFKKYGADICRLWAGSADYHVDVRCSDAIFKQLSQNYLKFRNTAKYCLDNLTDFDPNHLTAPADMEALDRWAITKLNELLVRCEAAYKDYEFLTVSHAVNDFCVVTLSSLYLDIIKDRLYCDGKDSASRRSAQSALWMILDAMTKVFAPILAFTCDEIWLQMPHRTEDDPRNVVLNQMTKPYADYALSEAEMTAWETAFRLRSDVNGVLETARADKRIGKSLEAHVALFAKDEDTKAALEAVKAIDLPEIFIVSNVSTDEAAPAEGAVVEAGVSYPGLTVAVSEAKGTKCPRCWMHSETPDEHGLCPRCAAVCKALNVVFE